VKGKREGREGWGDLGPVTFALFEGENAVKRGGVPEWEVRGKGRRDGAHRVKYREARGEKTKKRDCAESLVGLKKKKGLS